MNNAFDLRSGNATVTTNNKLLNGTFSSFAEAYSTFAEFVGNNNDDINIGQMIRHFLTANQLPIFRIDTTDFITNLAHYFESTEWVVAFLERNNFFQFDDDQFVALDWANRPVGFLRIKPHKTCLLTIEGTLAKTIYDDLVNAIQENIKVDHNEDQVVKRHTYHEVIFKEGGMFGNTKELGMIERTMAHSGETHLSFYPYLNGGVVSLIEDFIQSDETVLILMGEPGTGKSTAISSACVALNLLPIYAKKTEVITDPSFVSKIFEFSDRYMEKAAIASGTFPRQELFKDHKHFENSQTSITLPAIDITGEKSSKKAPSFPVIIVEDGDLLIAPRSEGNTLMSELLNETDGVGSTVTRKLIITTNITDKSKIDSALMRDGRHYLGEPLHFRMLTPMEAIEARSAAGLPQFETAPKSDIPLATALRKPRKKIYLQDGEVVVGKNNTLN